MKQSKSMLSVLVCLMLLVSMMTGITVGATEDLLTFTYLANEFDSADSTAAWKFSVDASKNNALTYVAGAGVGGSGALKVTGLEYNDRLETVSAARFRKNGSYEVKVWMKASAATEVQMCINTGTWMKHTSSHSNNGNPWIYRYFNKNVKITDEWQEYVFDIQIIDLMSGNGADAEPIDQLETEATIFICPLKELSTEFELYVDKMVVEEKISPNDIRNTYFENGVGDGSAYAPYQISSVDDVIQMNKLIHSNDAIRIGHYKLMNDLDFSGITNFKGIGGGMIKDDGTLGYYFGDTRRSFKGVFDGQGHVIKNLYIPVKPDLSGGFFRTIEGATIKNLGFENADVSGYRSVGILTGLDMGASTIENCYVRDSQSLSTHRWSNAYIGAMVGEMNSTTCPTSTYTNCYTTNTKVYVRISDVEGEYGLAPAVGGIVGTTMGSSISNVVLNNCYSDMPRLASNETDANTGLTKNNCYVSVTAGSLKASDLNSDVFMDNKKIGYNSGMPVFKWEADRQAVAKENNLFANGMGDGTEDNPYELTVAADILKMAELFTSDAKYRSAAYEMKNDIDLSTLPENFQGLGTYGWLYFLGTFDGNGYVIKNMSIDSRLNPDELGGNRPRGLFQALSGATVRNVGFENATVYAFPAAAVAGQDIGGSTIEGCFVRNSIIACSNSGWTGYAGGILGQNPSGATSPTTIKNCYTSGLSGADGVFHVKDGGIMGSQTWTDSTSANMINCYTTHGRLESVGSSADTANINLTVTNCYISATPETVTASQLGSAFIANETEYNNGLPVLAWEANRLPEVEEPVVYTVSVSVGANGSVTKDGAAVPASFEVEADSVVTLTLVPDAKYIAKAKVNGADYAVTNNQVTLTVTEDTTVEVTFERIPDVTPGFAGDNTSYSWFKNENGVPTIFTYHKLADFNTGETDLEYGVKLWNNAKPEEKVILPARVSETETAKAVPGAMFAIRVYGDAITADQSYTILPYIGTVTGSEIAPDFE